MITYLHKFKLCISMKSWPLSKQEKGNCRCSVLTFAKVLGVPGGLIMVIGVLGDHRGPKGSQVSGLFHHAFFDNTI